MHTAITFPENRLRTEFQHFIEARNCDKRFMGYEKYMNWFSYGVIIASVFFFIPVCGSIFSR